MILFSFATETSRSNNVPGSHQPGIVFDSLDRTKLSDGRTIAYSNQVFACPALRPQCELLGLCRELFHSFRLENFLIPLEPFCSYIPKGEIKFGWLLSRGGGGLRLMAFLDAGSQLLRVKSKKQVVHNIFNTS